MFKQLAVAAALAAVFVAAGLSAQSKAFSVQAMPKPFDDRWAPVDEAPAIEFVCCWSAETGNLKIAQHLRAMRCRNCIRDVETASKVSVASDRLPHFRAGAAVDLPDRRST